MKFAECFKHILPQSKHNVTLNDDISPLLVESV